MDVVRNDEEYVKRLEGKFKEDVKLNLEKKVFNYEEVEKMEELVL